VQTVEQTQSCEFTWRTLCKERVGALQLAAVLMACALSLFSPRALSVDFDVLPCLPGTRIT
jgi:hypothetical protein